MKNNWQHIGVILTGIAALITAGVGVYDKLKTVHQEVYKPILKREYGIVDDKDGWVNLREKPDVSSPSIARILNGTNLEILDKSGNWFKVYTESGRTGYVFKDRLILFEYQTNKQ
jgi:uncharacterized protein YgiM (DUF1202 family)